jgi:hypothetical protein
VNESGQALSRHAQSGLCASFSFGTYCSHTPRIASSSPSISAANETCRSAAQLGQLSVSGFVALQTQP